MDLLFDLLPWLVGGGGAGIVGVGGVLLYKADAAGWKADLRRISRNIRARVNANKAAKALEISSKQVEDSIKADWDAQFSGKELKSAEVVKKPEPLFVHSIARTWISHERGIGDKHCWKCTCGSSSYNWMLPLAKENMNIHIREGNAAEKLKQQTGGKRAW